jgi:DNA helicase-2/ATP-dependent DNA helicase PcrA
MIRQDDEQRDESSVRKALEEERRLAFVGMTRAKEELTLTCARERMVRGVTRSQQASPFLDEMGSDHVRFEELAAPAIERHAARGRGRHRGGFYDDADERAAIEAAVDRADGRGVICPPDPDPADADADADADAADVPPPPAEYERLVVNCRVRHPKFGEGKVVALRNRWPETRAEIIFDDFGHKTIWLKFTRLDVLESWE